jgi:hypothetical protein
MDSRFHGNDFLLPIDEVAAFWIIGVGLQLRFAMYVTIKPESSPHD